MKIVTENRQARFEYFIDETYCAGIVLEGAEVKSIRNNNVSLNDTFCHIYNGEVFIKNMHVAVYDKSGAFNTRDSRRDRKLLLRKAEINKLISDREKLKEIGSNAKKMATLNAKEQIADIVLGLIK